MTARQRLLTSIVVLTMALGWGPSARADCNPAECLWTPPPDCVVSMPHIIHLLASWGPCECHNDCPWDWDGSSTVGFSDLLAILAAWGQDCAVCGNGTVEAGEQCESEEHHACLTEEGYDGTKLCGPCCAGFDPCISPLFCGDGLVSGPEECDDANDESCDGCTTACTIYPGFVCIGQPSECELENGDGRPPLVTGQTPALDNYWMTETQTLDLAIQCEDPDGDIITYSWEIDGEVLPGENTNQLTLDGATVGPGVYEVGAYCDDNTVDCAPGQHFHIEIIEEDAFTVVALPDTQLYAQHFPDIFTNQTEWIVELEQRLGVVFVTHEGDIVNVGNNETQWLRANASMSVLDGGPRVVPFGTAIGNHDYGRPGGGGHVEELRARSIEFYDRFFPRSRFEAMVGGHVSAIDSLWDTAENFYHLLDIDTREGTLQFMIMHYEFCPRNAVVDWANQVIAEHSGRRVIATTHMYLHESGERGGADICYFVEGEDDFNDGHQQWDNLLKWHENLFMVLCGHEFTGFYRADEGHHGNLVHTLLADYQHLENGGNGWLRLMIFRPDKNEITVRTYSPWIDDFMTDEHNELTISYEMDPVP